MNSIPFYRELVDVLVGVDDLKGALSKLMWAIRLIERLTKEYKAYVTSSFSIEETKEIRREYFGRLSSVLRKIKKHLGFLEEARKKLKQIPDVNPELPTIVIAAAPNVGKSTLVKRISSAKPEIAPYPFTTKGLILGHMKIKEGIVIQVIDTPGLLDRPLTERNEIELQAIVALKHLAHVIVFMIDPTMHSGFTLDYQLNILMDIMNHFKGVPILVAINKIDIAKDEEIKRAEASLPNGIEIFKISASKGIGVEELYKKLIKTTLSDRI